MNVLLQQRTKTFSNGKICLQSYPDFVDSSMSVFGSEIEMEYVLYYASTKKHPAPGKPERGVFLKIRSVAIENQSKIRSS